MSAYNRRRFGESVKTLMKDGPIAPSNKTFRSMVMKSLQETSLWQTSFESGSNPNERLMIPFVFENGTAVLAFGWVGELGLGLEESSKGLADAKNITFF